MSETAYSTCLWFDSEAEAAARYYCEVLPDAVLGDISRYSDAGPGEPGKVLTVGFRLGTQEFMLLNGGPHFTLTEAASISVSCSGQDEVDRLWEALTADGGEESQCGWLKDRWGVSWQIVPRELVALLSDPDPGRSSRAMTAMLGMRKIDIAAVQAAADAA